VQRLAYSSPYLYTACNEAGVCVYESTAVGVAGPKPDEGQQAWKRANVVRGVLLLTEASSHKPQAASLMDVSGRRVMDLHSGANDVRALAPGVYFVRGAQARAQAQVVRKIVLTE